MALGFPWALNPKPDKTEDSLAYSLSLRDGAQTEGQGASKAFRRATDDGQGICRGVQPHVGQQSVSLGHILEVLEEFVLI